MQHDRPFNHIFENGIIAPRWLFLADGTAKMEYTSGTLAITAPSTTFSGPVSFASSVIFAANFAVAYSNTSTTDYYDGPSMIAQNTSATAGNFAAIRFQTANSLDYAAIWGKCTVHTIGSGAGDIIFGTANGANVATERMRLSAAGVLALGVTAKSWSGSKAFQVGATGSVSGHGTVSTLELSSNVYFDGTNWKYAVTDYASLYQQYNGSHTFYGTASGTAGNTITWTQVLAVLKGSSVALEGALPQTGTGITFPATQSASSNVNTLDDYEEGTWTPELRFGGSGGCTYSTQEGTYQKVGNRVHIGCAVTLSNNGSGVGTATLYGFPFTSAGSQSTRGGSGLGYVNSFAANYGDLVALIETSATYATLRFRNFAGGATSDHTDTTIPNTGMFYFYMSYTASA